ncbi:MAG: hypothetical protein LBU84_19025 [Prevotella sp.]|jgi:hypothetical protein|nr:hypothetical protein [Prevotella sp.]
MQNLIKEQKKLSEEKDNINIRLAYVIEELCSDDFSLDDEIEVNTPENKIEIFV